MFSFEKEAFQLAVDKEWVLLERIMLINCLADTVSSHGLNKNTKTLNENQTQVKPDTQLMIKKLITPVC